MTAQIHHMDADVAEYVTLTVGGQLFGLPIAQVHDVFAPGRLTPIPTAPKEFAGVLNLRGRIVTAIDMRMRLGMARRGERDGAMAIGIDSDGESYGLLIDTIGEVIRVNAADRQPVPANLDSGLSAVAAGIHRLEDGLLVVLDVQRLLDIQPAARAA
jgi:purine-binding chemotaxis protein CheW